MEKLTSYKIKSIKIDFCPLTSEKKLLVDICFINNTDLKPLFNITISKSIHSIYNIEDFYFSDFIKYNDYKESINNSIKNKDLMTFDKLDIYYEKTKEYRLNNLDGLCIAKYWINKHFGSEYLYKYILHANQMTTNIIINPKPIQLDSSSDIHEFIEVYDSSFIFNNKEGLILEINNSENTLYLSDNDDYGFVKYFSNNEDLNKELIRIRRLQPLFVDIDLITWEKN